MPRLNFCLLFTASLFLFSCTNKDDQNSISDFRESIQPLLNSMVTYGVVAPYEESKIGKITHAEWERLSRSEHPILRAIATGELFRRDTTRAGELLLSHLNDTAWVAVDHGEFGVGFEMVADYLIYRCHWESIGARDSAIEIVLKKHNYLRSAYTILLRIDPQEKYYGIIKDMATRPRRLDRNGEGYELGFDDIEHALYGLARFKKEGDAVLIRNRMQRQVGSLSDLSFRLMTEYPDSLYMDILQEYHRRQFYRFSGNRPHGFSGVVADDAAPEDFIRALVAQRSDRSARLLDTMLQYLPKRPCFPDKDRIIDNLVMAIWEHPCPAYEALRKKIRVQAETIQKGYIQIPLDPGDQAPMLPQKRTLYHWYY